MPYQGGLLKFLNEEQKEKVHQKTLDILREIGVRVENKKALELFDEKGAEVDFDEEIVRLPNSMVEEAIDSAPSKVILYGREDKHNIELGGTNVYLGTGGTAVNVLDIDTGERRRATSKDVVNTAKLVQSLDNIDFFVVPVFPDDAGKEGADEARFFNAMKNTTKHIMGGIYTLEGQKKVIDAAVRIAGSEEALKEKPFISFIANIMSPLTMERDYTDYFRYAVERGVPVVGPPAPIAGATSPIALPGTIVQTNAEALFMVIFSQIIEPGAKTLYSVVPTTMDMKSSDFRFSSIEMGMMNSACAEMAQYYDLPIYNTAGVSDSKVPDIQAGYEKMSNILLAALSGANYIHDAAGLLNTGMSVAYEQYVIDNQMLGMAKRVLRGLEFSEDRLAYDEIKEVGPGGNFLTQASTLQYMRTEFFDDALYDATDWEDWVKDGGPDARERAKDIAREIIAQDSESLVDEELLKG
ncbi:trimethylamine methyltransferase family protein [Selenihalanaerobacter shriftii]|uniref:Methyltransferase n=1 Tax=Selenihalanaerobacter shriftii TaxID=142842 RepID=A0A1T4MQZ1_9FIRM|nr:trimethylamine methyltransferase family protein [Selenihalanaerobacter shriftii]SJZ69247.1 trimethylamine---corrinoid protein Co-methyltransferase [Selenihalanaerobacter shriftii]